MSARLRDFCRLIVDPPADGAWNMAVDEALLEAAANDDRCTLRFYRWSQATLSLGYFQAHEDRALHPASFACPLVRRSSGGGAILHDREFTYSLAVPPGHRLGAKPQATYAAVHEALAEWLRSLGGETARLCAAQLPRLDPASEPFLCFQRRARGDLLLGEHKICGSAQRRRHGAVLQHGSLLLSRSPHAPELPGINDLVPKALLARHDAAMQKIVADILVCLSSRLKLEFAPAEAPMSVLAAAAGLSVGKHESTEWVRRR